MGADTVGDMVVFIIGGAVGLIAAIVALALSGLIEPRRHCPDCGTPLPRIKRSRNWWRWLLGGWTCPKCHCQINHEGRKIRSGNR
jgi:hypothetical protein